MPLCLTQSKPTNKRLPFALNLFFSSKWVQHQTSQRGLLECGANSEERLEGLECLELLPPCLENDMINKGKIQALWKKVRYRQWLRCRWGDCWHWPMMLQDHCHVVVLRQTADPSGTYSSTLSEEVWWSMVAIPQKSGYGPFAETSPRYGKYLPYYGTCPLIERMRGL